MPEPIDLKTLDRLEDALLENQMRTKEQGGSTVRLPFASRIREYEQMLHLVREFKAAITPKP